MNGVAFRHHFRVPLNTEYIPGWAMLKAFHQAVPAQCGWNQLRRQDLHSLMVEAVYPKSFHSVALPQKRAFISTMSVASGWTYPSCQARKTCHCQQPNTGHAARKIRIITTV